MATIIASQVSKKVRIRKFTKNHGNKSKCTKIKECVFFSVMLGNKPAAQAAGADPS